MCQAVLLGMRALFVKYHCTSGRIDAQVGEAPSCSPAKQAQEADQSELQHMHKQHVHKQQITAAPAAC